MSESKEVATHITRTIENSEDVWGPSDVKDRGPLLSVDDQKGEIEMELTVPLQLTNIENPIDSLTVRAPTTKEVRAFQAGGENQAPSIIDKKELELFGGCCIGIKPEDVENLHARDWSRLSKLVTSFLL